MKNFTELTLSNRTNSGLIAQYLDEQMSEEELVLFFGANPVTYGLIAALKLSTYNLSDEFTYPLMIHKKPKTQSQFDKIFDKVSEMQQ
jgi:hypothetical protein